MKKLFAVLGAIILIGSFASAQLKQGAFGIQAGVTGGSELYSNAFGISSGSTTLTGLYNVDQKTRIGIGIGFVSVSPSVGSSTSDFQIAAMVDYYLSSSENLSTIIGGRLGYLTFSPGSGTSITGVDVGAKVGAEYAFSSRFSIQAFVGLEYLNGGPSGKKTSQIGTISGTMLSFYF
jgi:hypothetical protein